MVLHNLIALAFCFTTIVLLIIVLDSYFPQTSAAASSCNPSERDALLHFKLLAVGKDPTDDWFSSWLDPRNSSTTTSADYDCCRWNGVSCDSQGRVISIRMDTEHLCPYTPHYIDPGKAVLWELKAEAVQALTAISGLSILDFSCQRFHGSIPEEIGNLTSLTQLILFGNQLTGIIPSTMRYLNSLNHLDLGNNQLEGQIPDMFKNLTKIDYLDLSSNNLSGLLPSSMRYLNSLNHLGLSENQLVGHIPDMFKNLTKIDYLELSFNDLSGLIPPSIHYLRSLTDLYLGGNHLVGDIPDMFTNLTKLRILDLSFNNFSGLLPPMQYLQSLEELDINANPFSPQNIPSHVLQLPSLLALNLSSNNFIGPIPDVFTNYSNIEWLDLSYNRLDGALPPSLQQMKTLYNLLLSNNQLCHEIPSSLLFMPSLGSRDFSFNNFTGISISFPSSNDENDSKDMYDSLLLSSNKLTIGSIFNGTSFPLLKNIGTLDLSDNQLEGPIPDSWADIIPNIVLW